MPKVYIYIYIYIYMYIYIYWVVDEEIKLNVKNINNND